jgi:hypothetical protein
MGPKRAATDNCRETFQLDANRDWFEFIHLDLVSQARIGDWGAGPLFETFGSWRKNVDLAGWQGLDCGPLTRLLVGFIGLVAGRGSKSGE